MTISAASVATAADLAEEIGGATQVTNLLTEDGTTAEEVIAKQLADVLDHLRNREPPIRDYDISVPAELKRVVVLGSLASLYRSNMTTGGMDDVNARKSKDFQAMYESRLNALRPTVAGLYKAQPFGISIHRR